MSYTFKAQLTSDKDDRNSGRMFNHMLPHFIEEKKNKDDYLARLPVAILLMKCGIHTKQEMELSTCEPTCVLSYRHLSQLIIDLRSVLFPYFHKWLVALHSRPVFRDGFLLAYSMWC